MAFGEEVVDGAEGAADDLGDACKTALDAVLGDFEEPGFGGVEDLEGVVGLVGGLGDGLGADNDELAQEGLVFNDPDVFFD